MTQPPSAAALEFACKLQDDHERWCARGPARYDIAEALDVFAAQAVSAAQGDYARMEPKIKAMRKEAKPSREAQTIRGAIMHELDEDNEFTDLACDLLDIAAERGLAAAAIRKQGG